MIYLCGPMTGLPEFNYPAFHQAARALRALGHRVYNPAEFPYAGPLDKFPVRSAFEVYTRFICREACTIATLPGWERSSGARVEVGLGERLGLHIVSVDGLLP